MTDLAEFITAHATPYDPDTDTYRRPPFAAPIKAGKNTPIYNAHSYHTKVPPQGIVPYIEHYTDPSDLVLDPFCGSGMTGVACLASARHALLNDLSPAATHIAYNFCTPVDTRALRREFARIKAAVKEELDWLYSTSCDRCGGPATIQYMVWSDVLECSRCAAPMVLWDVAVDHDRQKVQDPFTCPICGTSQRKREARWLYSTPVVTNYECQHCPQARAEHRTTDAERRHIDQVAATAIPYWYPTTPFRQQDWEMWRGVHRDQGITDVSRFYRPQALWAFARLWHEAAAVPDPMLREKLRFALTGATPQITKMTLFMPDGSGRGHRKGTLYIPSLGIEQNVIGVVERRLSRILRAWEHRTDTGSAEVIIGTASSLTAVHDSVVDYVFTDPPFGSNIFYADCNLLWEAWLDRGFTNQATEAVVHVTHRTRNTLPDYARLMSDSFREMYRVLKPGRWASVVFHNSDDRIWQVILDAAEAAGFELAEINSFDKEQRSFKGIRGAKGLERVTNKDIVLNLHKPRAVMRAAAVASDPAVARPARGNGDSEIRIVECIAGYLAAGPAPEGRTLQALWNTALGEMIRAGVVEVSMEQLSLMLPHYFKEVDGRWYLRGEAVLDGNVFDVRSDAGAIAWLTAVLAEPRPTGQLIPDWQAITAQAGGTVPGRLERLLEENFWLDRRSGKWRLPTETERARMSAQETLKDQAHLRVVRRFLAGQLPQQPTSLELAAWVQFCYSHKAYDEAVRLFALIDPAAIDAAWHATLERIVAVCRFRAGRAAAET